MKIVRLIILCLIPYLTACNDKSPEYIFRVDIVEDMQGGQKIGEILNARLRAIPCKYEFLGTNPEGFEIKIRTKIDPGQIERILTRKGEFGIYGVYDNSNFNELARHFSSVFASDEALGPLDSLLAAHLTLWDNYPYRTELMECVCGADTAAILMALSDEPLREMIPHDGRFYFMDSRACEGTLAMLVLKVLPPRGLPLIDGSHIRKAYVEFYHGSHNVNFEFDGVGTSRWERITDDHIGRNLALVMDGRVLTAPRVQSSITGGKCNITGLHNEDEAIMLTALLSSDILESRLRAVLLD